MTRYESVPDEQHDQCADGCADKPRTLIKSIPTDGLPDEGRDERAGDPKRGREDEAGRIVFARRQVARDDASNEANYDDPDNVSHDSFLWCNAFIGA